MIMSELIQPVVIASKPFEYESLKGYILRVSAENAYPTPAMMLGSAGFSKGEMDSIIPPLKKLKQLFLLTQEEILELGYQRPGSAKVSKHIFIYDHYLPTYNLCIKEPRICVDCVLEKGYIESYTDIKHIVLCPIHRRYLIKDCPACHKKLSWFRPALLKCKCGFDLSKIKGDLSINKALIGLTAFISNQLRHEPHDFNFLKHYLGFPLDNLDRLKLPELLAVLNRFENKYSYANYDDENVKTLAHEAVLTRASKALENWPEGLYKHLDSFRQERASTEGFGLRKQFESFYGSLFKSKIPKNKIKFIKDAFVGYGNDRWKQGYVTTYKNIYSPIVGIYGLSKALGVMPSTARRLVSNGSIVGKTSHLNGRTRNFFDISQTLPFKISNGKSLTIRKAAKYLDIPVSVLKILRDQGIFKVQHIANPTVAYHEQDVINFRDQFLNCASSDEAFLSEPSISLKQAMAMKIGASKIKANFITAVLNSEITIVFHKSERLSDLLFKLSEVKQFFEEQKKQVLGYCTLAVAAKYLHCDPLVVKNLSKDGLLESKQKSSGTYIKVDSVKEFHDRYVSCAFIAAKYKTSSNKIVRECENKQIDLVLFSKFNINKPQPFLNRADAKSNWSLIH